MGSKEWSSNKKWNPFNSDKLLTQIYRWREIKKGNKIPQPALITIDPANICNLRCSYCNAAYILDHNKEALSERLMNEIPNFLSSWQSSPNWQKGVEAVCVAGGGEPMINKNTSNLILKCIQNNIEVGVVSNGTLIDRSLDALSKCTWVGISVDASTKDTFLKLKGKDEFDRVISNIEKLSKYSEENKTRLSLPYQGYGISYKYLLHPLNVREVYDAAVIAKKIGCKNFHLRPVGVPWDKIEKDSIGFSMEDISIYNAQIEQSHLLEDDNFGTFGITHKFGNKLDRSNCFERCHAVFMTAVICPGTEEDTFNFGLCCDRRGDPGMFLGTNLKYPEQISDLWGSDKHWEICDKIKVEKCPRCTYQPHNIIFDNVILSDNMTYKFI